MTLYVLAFKVGLQIEWLDIVPGAQTERRGGAGPVGACLTVRTPPAAGNHLSLAGLIAWLDETQDPEHIVVAGGSVIVGDGGHQVHAQGPACLYVDAATLTLAVAAPEARGTADREVVTDLGTQQGEGREFVLEDPAPLAVRAVAAGASRAAEGEVVVHGGVADGQRRPEEIGEAAAPAIAAVAAGASRAADRGVVADGAVAEAGACPTAKRVEEVQATAPGQATVLSGGAGAANRRVVLDCAAGDGRHPTGDVDGAAGRFVGAKDAVCWGAALVAV